MQHVGSADLVREKNIHFVGLGGIGMSGIAHVLLQMGYRVSGSDIVVNDLMKRMEAHGGRIFSGHHASNLLPDTAMLVYSSSIAKENPELREAKRRGVRIVHRADLLGALFNAKKGVAITGTHGKTTTTSLISVIFKYAGLDPTVIIGGEVGQFNGNSSAGSGAYLVAEADESDSSFLRLSPYYAVITNIELEHMDHYRDMGHIRSAYRAFADRIKDGGMLFYHNDDLHIRAALRGFKKPSMTYGLTPRATIYARGIRMNGFKTTFSCVYKKKVLGTVTLAIPGRHNVLNALAAILVGLAVGIDFSAIVSAIADFHGAKRRFQLRAERGNVMLIDDYAHHPTEIRAVLDACASWGSRRIIAVFQPHRYSRVKFLSEEFGACFAGVSKLILTEIYAASEAPIEGISADTIHKSAMRHGVKDICVLKKEAIADYVMKIKKPGDIVLVLGAGDIKAVADVLAKRLSVDVRPAWRDKLKKIVKGALRFDEPLSRHTTFRIGGPADAWAAPRDVSDLKRIVRFARKYRIPYFVIGNGSNLLVDDSGYRGIVISLDAPAFTKVAFRAATATVGGGYRLAKLVKDASARGLEGLESLVGIPGTIGGSIRMNAGGWMSPMYRNIGGLVTSVKVMDAAGEIRTITKKGLTFSYRSSNLGEFIILQATMRFKKSSAKMLNASIVRFLRMKKEKQALDVPSAGCIFKNPPESQFTCGQMIDMLGLKGTRIGGAEISPKHANFIVNRGAATCADVTAMIALVKERVRQNYAIDLELEVKII